MKIYLHIKANDVIFDEQKVDWKSKFCKRFILKQGKTQYDSFSIKNSLCISIRKFLLFKCPDHFLISFSSESNDSVTMFTKCIEDIHRIHNNFVLFIRNLWKKERKLDFRMTETDSILCKPYKIVHNFFATR